MRSNTKDNWAKSILQKYLFLMVIDFYEYNLTEYPMQALCGQFNNIKYQF
jgi:hypothetical protein